MSNVYYKKITSGTSVEDIKRFARDLLDTIISKENIKLESKIPLKVHFGEIGNITFIKPENFDGIIDYLEEKKIKSSFIETAVIYGGQRYKKDLHLKTAKKHGFTRLPVIIADGDLLEYSLFAWSTVHGLATLATDGQVEGAGLSGDMQKYAEAVTTLIYTGLQAK